MSIGSWLEKAADKVTDYIPGVSNVKGAIEGDWAQAAGGPFAAAAEDAANLLKKYVDPSVQIKGLGQTATDPNVLKYSVPPDVAAAYAAVGNTSYTPQTVTPGFSVGDIATKYAVTPQQVAASYQDQTRSNADFAHQDAIRQSQLAEAQRLGAVASGRTFTAADQNNLDLLRQAQAFQTSAANTARGGSEQRLAAQRDAQTANVEAAQNNIATLAAQRAQEQSDARTQLASMLSGAQGQDQAWLGAAYNIANADATRAAQAAVANQQAGTSAAIANKQAVLQGVSADQTANYNAFLANQNAQTQAYRDQTARQLAAGQGALSAAQLGINAGQSYTSAQQGAKQTQLEYQDLALQRAQAKANKKQQIAGAGISTGGQILAKVASA